MTLGEQDPTAANYTDDTLQQDPQTKQRGDDVNSFVKSHSPDTRSIEQEQPDCKNNPSTGLEKETTCDTGTDMNTLALYSDDGRGVVEQQDTLIAPKSPLSYSSHDHVVILIMASSTIDKNTTINGLQQKGYYVRKQELLQLSQNQINTLYDYDTTNTKSHYQQLFEGWKQSSISNPVEMVLLEKENAVQSFQALVNEQNSTKKKNRLMDPDSVYVSSSQEIVKRDIELLFGTPGSNDTGDYVSSATADNHDDTVTQALDGSIEKHIPTPSSSVSALPENTNCDINMVSSITCMDSTILEQQQQSSAMIMDTVTTDSYTTTATFNSESHLTTDAPPSPPMTQKADKASITSSFSEEDETSINENNSPSTIDSDTVNSNPDTLDQTTEIPMGEHDEDTGDDHSHDISATTSADKIAEQQIPEPAAEQQTPESAAEHVGNDLPSKTSTDNSSSGNGEKQVAELESKTGKGSPANKYAIKKQSTQGVLQNSSKKKTPSVAEAARKTGARSDTKAPTSQPLKSKIRVTTAARTTTALTKPTGTDDSKKTTADETKKKTQRIPRVALLAQQNNKASANPPPEEQQQVKPKIKAPKGAIARLSAPTAASSRRHQSSSTTVTGPSTPQVTMAAAKGTNVTATLKSEQRKKRQEQSAGATKNETPSSNLKTRLTKSSGNIKKKPMESNIPTVKKEDDIDQKILVTKESDEPKETIQVVTETNDTPSPSGTSTTDSHQESEQGNKAASTSSSTSLPSTSSAVSTDIKEQDDEKEKKTDNHTATLLQSPAESSTTSSRPETPVQQQQQQTPQPPQQPQQPQPQPKPKPQSRPLVFAYERAAPTATPPATTTGMVTLDTVNATPIRLIDHHQKQAITTSKVKDLLGRFM